MKIVAVIQARMGSSRLPGKVLRPIAGRPMLQYTVERLDRCRTLDGLLVATTTDPSDDEVVDFCARVGVACTRGPVDDVVSRIAAAARAAGAGALVRVCGDSPLLDYRLVDALVGCFRNGAFDVVTNVAPRSFPPGQSVEVISTAVLLQALDDISAAEDREHVTPFFYRQPERFRIRNMSASEDYTRLRLAVDTPEDFRRISAMIAAMKGMQWEYGLRELLRLDAQLAPA
jgi:spore coat polysaccharide biosynthesis protein SpsF